jgi:diketogulonate reductase-like aldo/keto reductase
MSASLAPIPVKRLRSGFALPAYGLGTWGIGGYETADTRADAAGIAAIRSALDRGVTHIDTAEMYGAGHAEELVGAAIRGVDRARLCLASKALAHHLDYHGLIAAAEGSLRRLGTDYLDLYMIHHPSDAIPIEETLAGMARLVERGLVRHVGVSNFARARLAAARRAGGAIVANQAHYSLAVREPETTGLLRDCQAQDMLLVAWKPQAPGVADAPIVQALARKYGRTPAQVGLNWLLSQENVVVISRTRDPRHLEENLGALGWALEAADHAALRRDYPGQQARSETYALR